MVSNVGRTLSDFSIPSSQRAASDELGQEDFLKLMVEQMRNQNPLDPQDNGEFFSQMAQFQSVDAMTAISKAINTLVEISGLSNASTMIGRTIVAEVAQRPDPDTGFPRPPKEVSGVVDRVTFSSSGAVLHIGDLAIPASAVVEVTDPVAPAGPIVGTPTTADITAELLAQLEALGVLGLGGYAATPAAVPAAGSAKAVPPADETVVDETAGDEVAA